ncbi:MAG: PrsW family glutamic-type intramembrane protease [Blastocatellia bacterium]|nr:PrsW family glutamic-type intramembrane protease [Blastocatellia bacterium]
MLTIALSIIPCLIWLAFFYFQDWYDKEPVRKVALTFLFGALATIPAFILNTIGGSIILLIFGTLLGEEAGNAAMFFIVVGPVEEGVKFLAVYIYAYHQPEFDEPADGVVYSAAAALGFAAIENILYLTQAGLPVILLRAPLSNPGHAFFAAFWGLAMSRAKGASNLPWRKARWLIGGWLVASFMHGLFDTLLSLSGVLGGLVVALLVLLLMGAMFVFVEVSIIRAVARSPHRTGTQLLTLPVSCERCGTVGLSGGRCLRCGSPLSQADLSRLKAGKVCRACGNHVVSTARFCTSCGANLETVVPAPQNLLAQPQNYYTAEPHFVGVNQKGVHEILFVINRMQVNVGKTLDNEFVIDHPSVSKHHARVIWHPSGYFYIADLRSTNGTYVNGERVSEQWLLDGYEVRLGDFRLTYRGPRNPINIVAGPMNANRR